MRAAKVALALVLAGGISVGGALLGERWAADRASDSADAENGAGKLKRLPSFALRDEEGRERRSSDWSGKPLVLFYWATWCQACEREVAALASVQAGLGPSGLQVVGIAYDKPEDLRAYLAKRPLGYPSLIATLESLELTRELGNLPLQIPFAAVFDRDGDLVGTHAGEIEETALRNELAPLLARQADPGT